MNQNDLKLAEKRLLDPGWRLSNLYHVIDKHGTKTKFVPNWAQQDLLKNVWYCNVILKARQLGISTLICLLFLDRCLFNSNLSCGIIAHTIEDSEAMFRRVKFAYDSLPEALKQARACSIDRAREMTFNNGSSIRVGTSMRGSTLQYLHISEFGKICAKYPDKAQEIITGSLNTIAPGQYVFIESTAEGREGYFYELCKQAQADAVQEKVLSKLDFKFHFFPWHKEPEYRIGNVIQLSAELSDYFQSLSAKDIHLAHEQKFWYAARAAVLGDDMMREYPSTPEEAWQSTEQGLYYGKQMLQVRMEKRIGRIPYDKSVPVFTAWDLGFNDCTAIWFFQMVGKEIHLIDYAEGSGESLAHWLGVVKEKGYVYEKHFAPHDIEAHEYSSGMSRKESARKMGINFFTSPKLGVIEGIDAARNILNRCWFDEHKCEQGIRALEHYKKEWNERTGTWNSQPKHDWSSHGADAFRTLAVSLNMANTRKESPPIPKFGHIDPKHPLYNPQHLRPGIRR